MMRVKMAAVVAAVGLSGGLVACNDGGEDAAAPAATMTSVAASSAEAATSSEAETSEESAAPESSEPAEVGEAPPAPPAVPGRGFQFQSGFLEIAPFEPSSFTGEMFDMCADITQEEFLEAHMSPPVNVMQHGSGTFVMCSTSTEGYPATNFIGTVMSNRRINHEVDRQYGAIIDPSYSSEILPEIYVTTEPADGMHLGECTAQLETSRGQLYSIFTASDGPYDIVKEPYTMDQLCTYAIGDLERLFQTFGVEGQVGG